MNIENGSTQKVCEGWVQSIGQIQQNELCALEHEVVWHDKLPYIAPDFLYQGEMDKDMIYYYKVPRSDVQYETETGIQIAKFHLFMMKNDPGM